MRKIILCILIFLSLVTISNAKIRKVVYIVADGIPADYVERVHPKTIFEIAQQGAYSRAYTGGEIDGYSQTPTISAIGYTNILTGTWMNKHNVNGNDNLKPNYPYWSLFRIAKEQPRKVTTGLFSSWTDNRTVLIGANKPETNNLYIDYVADGYDIDKVNYPKKKDDLQIFDIDSTVAEKAALCIKEKAPDLSWVYFWYTDDAFHIYGDGEYSDFYLNKTDKLIAKIWESVQYREKNFDEEWLVIVTTDHGREETGHGHGGQTERERTVWISTNLKAVNQHFHSPDLSLVDINPTICHYLGFQLPQEVKFEQDGISFLGKADISHLTASYFDRKITLKWNRYKSDATSVDIYVSFTNEYPKGGKDTWIKVATVPTENNSFVFNKNKYPDSKFYKFTVVAPGNHLSRWCR